jgi:hypothetical protein
MMALCTFQEEGLGGMLNTYRFNTESKPHFFSNIICFSSRIGYFMEITKAKSAFFISFTYMREYYVERIRGKYVCVNGSYVLHTYLISIKRNLICSLHKIP